MNYARLAYAQRFLKTAAERTPLERAQVTMSKSQLLEAIGEASMCWERPEGAGVFDTERALGIADRLEQQQEKQAGLWEQAGKGAKALFGNKAVGKALQPLGQVAATGLGAAALYTGAKKAIHEGRRDFRRFDPNVMGYSAQRTNPQYSYQEVY